MTRWIRLQSKISRRLHQRTTQQMPPNMVRPNAGRKGILLTRNPIRQLPPPALLCRERCLGRIKHLQKAPLDHVTLPGSIPANVNHWSHRLGLIFNCHRPRRRPRVRRLNLCDRRLKVIQFLPSSAQKAMRTLHLLHRKIQPAPGLRQSTHHLFQLLIRRLLGPNQQLPIHPHQRFFILGWLRPQSSNNRRMHRFLAAWHTPRLEDHLNDTRFPLRRCARHPRQRTNHRILPPPLRPLHFRPSLAQRRQGRLQHLLSRDQLAHIRCLLHFHLHQRVKVDLRLLKHISDRCFLQPLNKIQSLLLRFRLRGIIIRSLLRIHSTPLQDNLRHLLKVLRARKNAGQRIKIGGRYRVILVVMTPGARHRHPHQPSCHHVDSIIDHFIASIAETRSNRHEPQGGELRII